MDFFKSAQLSETSDSCPVIFKMPSSKRQVEVVVEWLVPPSLDETSISSCSVAGAVESHFKAGLMDLLKKADISVITDIAVNSDMGYTV